MSASASPPYRKPRSFLRPHHSPRRWRLLLWVSISAVFTLTVVQYSLRNGRLVLPPSFDDVGYMADGAVRLCSLYTGGARQVFLDYRHNPPHAPYSTAMAMLGFAVFGIRDWAPYAINGLLLLGYLAAADHLLRGLQAWQKLLGMIFMLSVPLTVMAIHEFRPDHACALLTVVGGLLILERPLLTATKRRAAFIGLLFGLALVTKPSTFPATVAIMLGTLALGGLADVVITKQLRIQNAVRVWGISIVTAVIVALPHFILAGHDIYVYIYDNIFGYRAGIWKTPGSWLYQMGYYVDPDPDNAGGGQMLGRHVFLIGFLLLASAVATLTRPRRKTVVRAGALFLFLFGTYFVVTTNPDKTVYFGLTFQTAAVLLALASLRQLLLVQRFRTPRVPWATTVLLLAVAGGIGEFRWPRRIGVATEAATVARRDIAEGVYRTIAAADQLPTDGVLIEGVGDINPDILRYYCARDQRQWNVYSSPDSDQLDVHMQALRNAEILVLSEPATQITAEFLLGYRVLGAMNAAILHDPNWIHLGYFVFPPSNRGIYVLRKRHPEFMGWTSADGLGPREGPYYARHLPIVHWGLGPATTLHFVAPEQPVDLCMNFRCGQANEAVKITLDGRPILSQTFPPIPDFQAVRVPLDVKPGTSHDVCITYATWDDSPDLKRSILFKELAILPR